MKLYLKTTTYIGFEHAVSPRKISKSVTDKYHKYLAPDFEFCTIPQPSKFKKDNSDRRNYQDFEPANDFSVCPTCKS